MKKILLILFLVSGMCYSANPQIVTPTPYETCEEIGGSGSGTAIFDLSTKNAEILGGESPVDNTVTYHITLQDAIAGTLPLPMIYTNPVPYSQTIYVRVTNDNLGTYAVTDLELIVNPLPEINEPNDMVVYQAPFTGTATFDLTSQVNYITGGNTDYSVIFYSTEADAMAGTGAFVAPSSYTNSTNPQTIWVRVENSATGCYTITNFNLIVSPDDIVYIPDANFKAKLIASSPTNHAVSDVNPNSSATPDVYTTLDVNGDGEVQFSEASSIIFMNVNSSSIASLEGIQAFANLQQIYCAYNNLASVDVSGLANLNYLGCYNNAITSINTTGCTLLSSLICNDNQLTSINLSALLNLQTLNINSNQITSLDLNNLQDIWTVYASSNNLTTLSVSDKNLLSTLNVSYNQLTSVDLNNLPHLYKINVQNNQLTSLDLSTCANQPYINNIPSASVYEVDCNNNEGLVQINLKNGFANDELSIMASNLSGLIQYICIDEDDTITFDSYNEGSFVSTYCNFTPGGNYNTITGNILFDLDNNGCDVADIPNPFIKVDINDGIETGSSFASNSGIYKFYTQEGTFTITPHLENPTFFTITPPSAIINFPLEDSSLQTQNFCLTANGIHPDIEVVVAPVVPARPGFDAVYKIVYKNKGNQVVSGNLFFEYDETVLDLISSVPVQDNQLSGYLGYNYTNLLPFESRQILVTLNVNSPTETPSVNIDDVLDFTANATITTGTDETPADNIFNLNQVVVGSYDPNDIQCLQGDIVSPSEIGSYLHYLVRFENTGTDYAQNIVVRDLIDETKYDISTIQILNSSHEVYARVNDNVAEFIFQNIYLDSGGHGNILLKIKSRENLVAGETVSNRANIFFDYNYPVDTNDANTLFQALGIDENELDNSVVLYPNPATSLVSIKADSPIRSIQLYDVQGRILVTSLVDESETSFDISGYSTGVYYVKITTDKGSKAEKLIKK